MPEIVKSRVRMLERAAPILRRLPEGGIMVEVGVSTALLGQHILQERSDVEWHGVDPWLGARDQPAAYVRTGDAHAMLSARDASGHMTMAMRRVLPFGDRVVVHREASPGVTRLFGPETVDLVFLDGDHSREGVEADIAGWWPIIRPYGWLGGHDYDNQDARLKFGVKDAVDAWVAARGFALELDTGMTWWVAKQ